MKIYYGFFSHIYKKAAVDEGFWLCRSKVLLIEYSLTEYRTRTFEHLKVVTMKFISAL